MGVLLESALEVHNNFFVIIHIPTHKLYIDGTFNKAHLILVVLTHLLYKFGTRCFC
jgi:hypothetical protein